MVHGGTDPGERVLSLSTGAGAVPAPGCRGTGDGEAVEGADGGPPVASGAARREGRDPERREGVLRLSETMWYRVCFYVSSRELIVKSAALTTPQPTSSL